MKKKKKMMMMEDLHELSRELVRDVLDLAEDVEAGPADPEHVASKAEEFIEVLGVISALSDQDIDYRVTANLEEVVHRFSGTREHQAQHTQGPGRLAFDIPSAVLEHQVLSGLPAGQIAAMFGVSKRTIRRRMKQNGLRYLHFFLIQFRDCWSHPLRKDIMFKVTLLDVDILFVQKDRPLFSYE